MGRHLDIDPVIVRVAFVVLTFFGGAGLLVYVACWLLLPSDTEPKARINLDPRSRSVALIAVGVLAALATIGDVFGNGWGGSWFPLPLLIVGAIAWWLLSRRDRKQAKYAAAYAAQHSAPTYGPPAYGPPAGWVGEAPAQPGYGSPVPPGTPGTTYGPPVPPYTPAPRLRDPRKRGPLLFWLTLPLIPLALGLLGVADLAGAHVADSAYPALALGIVAGMLVLGAFWGRAGGLILLGFLSTFVTIGALAAENWDAKDIHAAPTTAAAVESSYKVDGAGELVLDLTKVTDLRGLDGRTIELDAGIGRIEVIVPDRLNVTVDSHVSGAGDASVFGKHDDGFDFQVDAEHRGATAAAHVNIDATLGIGEIKVRTR
jgi:hypothetical protein